MQVKNKCCSSCKLSKPRSEFWRSSRNRDGLQSLCKACSRKRNTYKARVARSKKVAVAKRCPRCGQTKEPSEFFRNKGAKDGLQGYCKPCLMAYGKVHTSPEARERSSRKIGLKRFGLTIEDYDRMLSEQGGRCAICRTERCATGKRLSVDHDISTGKVRGLLCRRCNLAIGQFDHDRGLLFAAADYLAKTMA